MDSKELILLLSDKWSAGNILTTALPALTAEMEIDPSAALRRIYGISITGLVRDVTEHSVTVTVHGEMDGRKDSATGSIAVAGLDQTEFANAIKGAETQAKRRLTSSLLGFGYKGSREESVTPADPNITPKVPDTPKLNDEQATVTADTRATTPRAPAAVALLPTISITEAQEIATRTLASVPAVTEATIAKMHQTAQELSAPQPDLMSIVEKPVAPVTAAPQAGFFDEEPTQPPVVPQTPTFVAPAQPATQGTPAVPAIGVFPTTPEPAPVTDLVVPPPPVTDKPNRLQFQGYTQRCTKLVRDFLPKAGKDIPGLLLPFLKKSFGVSDLQQATILQWEEMLGRLEQGTPAQAASLIKGGK